MRGYFGYIRVSTTKQGEQGSSLQEQRSAIEGYAARHSLRIIEWFEEQETAASQGRPIFGEMLKAIDRGRAQGVITHKIDRSARNLKDWARIGDLIDRGIEMHFAHESLDLTSRSGRLSADILAVVASDYIRNLREEVRKGFYGRIKQGLYPLGAPIGYLDQGGGKPKIIDPIQGPLVTQAFELYATGQWSLHTLRDELHRRGLRNKRNGKLSITGLSTVLNNPFYVGIIRLRKTGEVFEGKHEALIDPRLFRDVANVLAGRTPRRGARRTYRYQRMVRCASCGSSLTPERQKGHVYYRCHTRSCIGTSLRQEHIDEQLHRAFGPLRFSDAELTASAHDVACLLHESAADVAKQLDRLGLQLSALEDRLLRTTDAYIDGVVDKEAYLKRKEELVEDRARLRARMAELRSADDVALRQLDRIFELLRAAQQLTISTSDENLRAVLVEMTSNLRAVGKKLAVDWRNPFGALHKTLSIQLGAPNRGDLRTATLSKQVYMHLKDMDEEASEECFKSITHESINEEEAVLERNHGYKVLIRFNGPQKRIGVDGMDKEDGIG